MRIRKLAILWNAEKPNAESCANAVKSAAEKLGAETVLTELHPVPANFLDGADACCVIGGDGTILGIAALAAQKSVPIFGVNRGKLGYLANYSAEDVPATVANIFSGKFRRARLNMLECRAGGQPNLPRKLALNDVVVKALNNFKMTELRVDSPNYGHVNTYHSDGVILTTSTGSTAYNLGAGGPLIHSEADVFALNPICPHTLSNRAIVLPRGLEIEIRNENSSVPVGISIDGSTAIPAEKVFPLVVRLSDFRLEILQPEGLSEFDILRKKLRWV